MDNKQQGTQNQGQTQQTTQRTPAWFSQFRTQFQSSFAEDRQLVLDALTNDHAELTANEIRDTATKRVQSAVQGAIQDVQKNLGSVIGGTTPAQPQNASDNTQARTTAKSTTSNKSASAPASNGTGNKVVDAVSSRRGGPRHEPRNIPGLGRVASMEEVAVALVNRRKKPVTITEAIAYVKDHIEVMPTQSRGDQVDSTVRNAFAKAAARGLVSNEKRSGEYKKVETPAGAAQ